METNVGKLQDALLCAGLFVSQTALALTLALAAGGHALAMDETDTAPPAATEFGLGPRASANRVYAAKLEPREPIRLRKLQTLPVRVLDAQGNPVDDASISIQGGMPEHRHGLPTQPRVTRSLGGGVYEIEGVRFSMGGWWELKLVIDSPAGIDSVTFNLGL